jgi:hypothetical protein
MLGRNRAVVGVLALVLAVTYASPAIGGPDLAGKLRRVDQREKRHYASLDRRLKAAALLAINAHSDTTVVSSSLIQSGDGHYFQGSASCPGSSDLVGGGADWGAATLYGNYQVVASAPSIGGSSWNVTLFIGAGPAPSAFPQVYAVCAR